MGVGREAFRTNFRDPEVGRRQTTNKVRRGLPSAHTTKTDPQRRRGLARLTKGKQAGRSGYICGGAAHGAGNGLWQAGRDESHRLNSVQFESSSHRASFTSRSARGAARECPRKARVATLRRTSRRTRDSKSPRKCSETTAMGIFKRLSCVGHRTSFQMQTKRKLDKVRPMLADFGRISAEVLLAQSKVAPKWNKSDSSGTPTESPSAVGLDQLLSKLEPPGSERCFETLLCIFSCHPPTARFALLQALGCCANVPGEADYGREKEVTRKLTKSRISELGWRWGLLTK